MKYKNNIKVTILFLEELILILSFLIAYKMRFNEFSSFFQSSIYRSIIIIILIIFYFVNYLLINNSDELLTRTNVKEFIVILEINSICILLFSLYLVLTKQSSLYSRLMFIYMFIVNIILMFIERIIYKKQIKRVKNRNRLEIDYRVLIIMRKNKINEFFKNEFISNDINFSISGLCVLDEQNIGKQVNGAKIVANKDTILSYLCHNWVDEVFIFEDYDYLSKELLSGLATTGIRTNILVSKIDEFRGQEQRFGMLFGYPVLISTIKERKNYQIVLKRLLDIMGGFVGSIITIFLILFIGPLICVKSPGPIFYKQERIGQNGRKFYIYKFRSMIVNADSLKDELKSKNRIKDGMMFKIENDPRIIPGIGSFIRKTSLDEFPQFFNVLKGDMSLVGTRPPTVDEWEKYQLEHRIRMTIKPGITGMWQVNGRSQITDFQQVVKLDSEYINNWSLALDIEIIIKTIVVLIFNTKNKEAM